MDNNLDHSLLSMLQDGDNHLDQNLLSMLQDGDNQRNEVLRVGNSAHGRKMDLLKSLYDESSNAVQNDSLLQSIIQCRNKAKEYDLFELQDLLNEILIPLAGKSKQHLDCQRDCYEDLIVCDNHNNGDSDGNNNNNNNKGCKSWKRDRLRKKYSEYTDMLQKALFPSKRNINTKLNSNNNTNRKNNNDRDDDDAINFSILLLGPKSTFDKQHTIQATMTKSIKFRTKTNRNHEVDDATKKQFDFEKMNPLQNLRQQEVGYQCALKESKKKMKKENWNDSDLLIDAINKADTLAKKSFSMKQIWTAELWWEKAIDLSLSLDSSSSSLISSSSSSTNTTQVHVKLFSNLAMLQIKIGRYLRSMDVGYRGLATQYLLDSIKNAKRGIEIDPMWERSYQRGAEAYLSLHPYEHALDAMKILKKAPSYENNITLAELQQTARYNATQWLRLKVFPKTTIPQAIDASLQNLRTLVSKSFPICYGTDTNANNDDRLLRLGKIGDDIADALLLVQGALQLIYTRRIDWERESWIIQQTTLGYQIQLRQVAKVVPLDIVFQSQKFLNIVNVEEPFTLWGMDRLDRLNIGYMKVDAVDPCKKQITSRHNAFDELLERKTGEPIHSTSMVDVLESITGKEATSLDQDMTNNHICAFTMTILERLNASNHYPQLSKKSSQRMIVFGDNENAMLMGGEFYGLALRTVCGIQQFEKNTNNTSKFKKFVELKGGLSTVGREIYQGGDPNQSLQQLVCMIPQEVWRRTDNLDIQVILYEYALKSLEGCNPSLDVNQIEVYAVDIILNIFEATLSDYTGAEADGKFIPVLKALAYSPLGQYLLKNFTERQKASSTDLKSCFKLLIGKWKQLSKKKKAAYRWESMYANEKEELSDMKPLSRVEKFQIQQEKGERPKAITKVSECEMCGKGEVPLKCTCKLVYYCSKECQLKNWDVHRVIHKKALAAINE